MPTPEPIDSCGKRSAVLPPAARTWTEKWGRKSATQKEMRVLLSEGEQMDTAQAKSVDICSPDEENKTA